MQTQTQLTGDPQGAPIGAPEANAQNQVPQEQDNTEKGPIPFQRFQEVIRQGQEMRQENREMHQQIAELQDRIKAFSTPAEKLGEFDAKKRDEAEYWKNPYEYERREKERLVSEFHQMQARVAETAQFESVKTQLRSSPEYTPELETKMADYIRNHGLAALPDRSAAVRASFEAVTGRKFGEWQPQGYQTTRQLKDRLARPSAGGGKPKMITDEDFQNMDMEEYEKNPKAYNEQVMAYLNSLQQ